MLEEFNKLIVANESLDNLLITLSLLQSPISLVDAVDETTKEQLEVQVREINFARTLSKLKDEFNANGVFIMVPYFQYIRQVIEKQIKALEASKTDGQESLVELIQRLNVYCNFVQVQIDQSQKIDNAIENLEKLLQSKVLLEQRDFNRETNRIQADFQARLSEMEDEIKAPLALKTYGQEFITELKISFNSYRYRVENRFRLSLNDAKTEHRELTQSQIRPIKIINFYTTIDAIKSKADDLRTRGYIENSFRAEKLFACLKEKSDTFFANSPQQQHKGFKLFQRQCLAKLLTAEYEWAKAHRGYKQIFINILQSLTVIGAIIGAVQWSVTGRYSLFPAQTASSKILDTACESVEEMGNITNRHKN